MSNDRDNRTEDALRRALSAQAQGVVPKGDGLMKIQQRVAAGDARMRWLRPVLAGGAAVIVIAAGVGGYAIAKNNDGNAKVVVGNSSPPTPPVATDDFPPAAFFPFADAAAESDWQQQFEDGGHSPWISDPEGVSEAWVQNYLEQHDVTKLIDKHQTATTADVTYGRNIAEAGVQPVVVVHLVKFRQAWLVTGATDPRDLLTISSPTPGATVDSPLTVTGPGFGVDEVAKVELREAETPDLIAEANTDGFGNGTPEWSATLSFTHFHPTAPSEGHAVIVVAMTLSAADGGVAQITVEKAIVGSTAQGSTAGSFYGVKNGRLIQFNAETGAKEADFNAASNFGTVFEARQFGDLLYFTARVGDCIPTLYSMPTDGSGTPTEVVTADHNYGIVGFDLSADGTKLTYLESGGCHQSLAGIGKLVFTNLTDGTSRKIDFPSEPPAIIGDPVWESDGVHVDAFVRTGMQGYLARYDSTSGSSQTPDANACSGYDINDGMPNAVTMSPDRTLWFATQTGSSMKAISCDESGPTVKFTVAKNDSPSALAVNALGEALLTDSSGHIWRWDGSGDPVEVSVTGVSSPTW